MKRIIVYADGTWNTPANIDNNKVSPTNVFKMFRDTDISTNTNEVQQLAYYIEGVGTGLGNDKIYGGLYGDGIEENIMEGYRFIVEHYEAGDEIFLIGFSRGAYTVRSIAGLIKNCGILKKQYNQKVFRAFEIYKSRKPNDRPSSEESKAFRQSFSHETLTTKIKFIGVWDTVGSLGVPFKLFRRKNRKHRFHDVQLSEIVENAHHAISIDEKRVFFRPTLWRKQDKESVHQQVLEQVWFNGVHSDVGGGYSEGELCHISLDYIINRAMRNGLRFKNLKTFTTEEKIKLSKSQINNSKDSLKYQIFPDYFRKINSADLTGLNFKQKLGLLFLKLIIRKEDEITKKLPTNEFLHESVMLRYHHDENQMPVNLKVIYKDLISTNRIIKF